MKVIPSAGKTTGFNRIPFGLDWVLSYDTISLPTSTATPQGDLIKTVHTGVTLKSRAEVAISASLASGNPVKSWSSNLSVEGSIVRMDSAAPSYFVAKASGTTRSIVWDGSDFGETLEAQQYATYEKNAGPWLLGHMIDSIDTRLQNVVSKDLNARRFLLGTEYVDNEDFWLNGIDCTCVSPWNSQDGSRRAGVLVTPRHVLLARHYQINTGSTIRFVGADGQPHDRTVLAKKNHVFSDNLVINGLGLPDFTVAVLSSDLPPSVTPVRVFPWDILAKLTVGIFPYGAAPLSVRVPAIAFNQDGLAGVYDVAKLNYVWSDNVSLWCGSPPVETLLENESFSASPPQDEARLIVHTAARVGDSGQPVFFLINNQLSLLGLQSGIGVGGSVDGFCVGKWAANHSPSSIPINGLNNEAIPAVDSMAGIPPTGYTIEEADLSMFPSVT